MRLDQSFMIPEGVSWDGAAAAENWIPISAEKRSDRERWRSNNMHKQQ